jgi:hypothetical protein
MSKFKEGDVVAAKREVKIGHFTISAGAKGVVIGTSKYGWGYIVKFDAIGPVEMAEMSIYGKDLELVK